MENHTGPLVSTHPAYSQDHSYNNMMSSLQNLDLGYGVCGNQEGALRNGVHGVFDASKYSCFSPKPHCVGQSHTVQGPQLVDHANWARQSNGEPLHAPVPCVPRSFIDTDTFSVPNFGPGNSWMYNEANQVPGISVPSNPAPAYDPSSMGGSTMNQNGYFSRGFTQPRSHDQNGNHNQVFAETRSNGQNGYNNQEFTGRSNGAGMPNPQDVVSVAMRNEGLMFLQNAVVVELVLCMRVMNEILCRALPQVEATKAVSRVDQQTLNRISSNVQDLPVPTHSKRIFVGGLSLTVTESDFNTYFGQFGTITNVEVMHDHITRRPRGFGFITFDSEEAVDRVLLRTSFHELNGKIAEVKRAIPKDIYRKSIRGQVGALNYGLSRVSNLLGAYTQGYNPSQVGGSGLKMDGRFSPVAVGPRGCPSFSPRYGMGPNLESAGNAVGFS